MSSMSRAASKPLVPKLLINRSSPGGIALDNNAPLDATLGNDSWSPCQRVISGAITANVLSTFFNVTGSGVISFMRVQKNSPAAGLTVRCKLTIDGNVVFDATSAATDGQPYKGMQIIGSASVAQNSTGITSGANVPILEFDQIPFSQSFKLEACTSQTETGNLIALAVYRTN